MAAAVGRTMIGSDSASSASSLTTSTALSLPDDAEAKQDLSGVIWEERVALTQLRNKIPVGYTWDAINLPQNCPAPFDDHQFRIMHPSLDLPHLSSQTASRSNQPFAKIHFPDRQTDRQTDRWDRRQLYSKSDYAPLY